MVASKIYTCWLILTFKYNKFSINLGKCSLKFIWTVKKKFFIKLIYIKLYNTLQKDFH